MDLAPSVRNQTSRTEH